MSEKTLFQWLTEADNFATEFENATGREPVLSDVIAECKDIGIRDYEPYARILYGYIEFLNSREEG